MALYTYRDAFVSLGGTDISDHVTALTLNVSIEAVDRTAMGNGTRA